MSEQASEAQVDPRVKVARDLREIEDLAAMLADQAEHKANAQLDGKGLPGGLAMVALAPVANLEAWENRQQASERYGFAYTSPEDEDPEWEPPLQTLLFWSEQWRVEHDAEYDKRPTLASEAAFIRWALDWAWGNLIEWEDFAADIRRARVRLENLLYAGRRAERTRVVCDRLACDKPSRLIKVYGDDPTGELDWWKCPACKHKFDAKGFRDAQARHLRHDGAQRFVLAADARGMLVALGRSERTIRQWFVDDKVTWYCDVTTHKVWVWWPDLWSLHLTTRQRNREVA